MLPLILALFVLAGAAQAQDCGNQPACPCPMGNVMNGGCPHSFTHLSDAGSQYPGMLIGPWLVIGPKQYGQPSVSNDQIALLADRLPAGSVAMFFQGTANVGQTVFGDGLRCVGGTITRLGVRPVLPGVGAQLGQAWISGVSALGNVPPQGGDRYYQCWYRNVAPFCTAATFNMTNAVGIAWAP